MTADEIAKLKTPLTDADSGCCSCCVPQEWIDADHARRLEQNQAALMEALELAETWCEAHGRVPDGPCARIWANRAVMLRETLAAVRERSAKMQEAKRG